MSITDDYILQKPPIWHSYRNNLNIAVATIVVIWGVPAFIRRTRYNRKGRSDHYERRERRVAPGVLYDESGRPVQAPSDRVLLALSDQHMTACPLFETDSETGHQD